MRDEVDRKTDTRVTGLDGLIYYEEIVGDSAGFSRKTIDLNRLALEKLKSFLVETGRTTDVSLITSGDIKTFIVYLRTVKRYEQHPCASKQANGLSGHTISTYLRALRAAFNRWVADGMIVKSPFEGLKLPKPPQKTIPIFTEAQIQAMVKAVDTSTGEGFRNALLIQLYLDTGCRLTEITNLRLDDIDWKMRTIKVMGKGKKERIVPIGLKVTKLLWQYIEKHRPQPAIPEYDYVFLTRYGEPLTSRRVERIFKKTGKKAGIVGVRCSPHTARHTFCSMWFRNGGETFPLQRITGHTSLEVLKGYVHLDTHDICQMHRECSPIDHLGRTERRRRGPCSG